LLINGHNRLLAITRNYGVILGIENIQFWHDFPLLNDPDNMLKLIDFLGTAGVVLDIYHSELANNTQHFIDRIGNFVVNAHISDANYTKNRMLPGEGKTNWKQLISSLKRIDYNGCLITELSQTFATINCFVAKASHRKKIENLRASFRQILEVSQSD
jgi:sugar phosphate isomerase/epimerase